MSLVLAWFAPPTFQGTPVSRAPYLRTPGITVIWGDYFQTDSPTPWSCRVRWTRLVQWKSFHADFQPFWNCIPIIILCLLSKDFKNTILVWFRIYHDRQMKIRFPRIPKVNTLICTILSSVNFTLKIILRDGAYPTIGNPDFLFVSRGHQLPAVHAVVELKTF